MEVAREYLDIVDKITSLMESPETISLDDIKELVIASGEAHDEADSLRCALIETLEELEKDSAPLPPYQRTKYWDTDANLCYRVSRWNNTDKKWNVVHAGTATANFVEDIKKRPDDTLMLTITDDSMSKSNFNPQAHLVWHPVKADFSLHAGSEFPKGYFALRGYDAVKMRERILKELGRPDPSVPTIT
jgi:hypothetical protein